MLQHRAFQGIQVKVTNFERSKSDYFVQLIVTTEKVVPDKKRIKQNKSYRFEQIRMQLADALNLSRK